MIYWTCFNVRTRRFKMLFAPTVPLLKCSLIGRMRYLCRLSLIWIFGELANFFRLFHSVMNLQLKFSAGTIACRRSSFKSSFVMIMIISFPLGVCVRVCVCVCVCMSLLKEIISIRRSCIYSFECYCMINGGKCFCA